jgi:hypothetical protein
MKKILFASLLVVSLLAVFVPHGEAIQEPQYRVKPIEPPPLDRPEVRPEPQFLAEGTGGTLPSYDGERFHVNLPGLGAEGVSGEDVRQVVDQVLAAVRFEGDPEAFQLKQTVILPSADKAFLEQQIEARLAEMRKQLAGELGSLSEATEAALQEQASELRAQALRSQEISWFEQQVEGYPLESAGIRVRWIEGRGLVAANGQVFSQIEVVNEPRLEAGDAVEVALAHVSASTQVLPEPRPEPVLVVLPYDRAMRFAWRLDVAAEEGSYRLWIDAESAEILRLEPLFNADGGQGRIFDPDPDAGTDLLTFEVNGPSGGQYELNMTGVLNENNAGADGVTSTDLTLADAGTGSADFDVAPINGTVVRCVSDTGYNSRFQEVNGYAWVHSNVQLMEMLGSNPFSALTLTVNHNNPCGFGINNACAGGTSIIMGIGGATLTCSNAAGQLYNTAIDTTVVTHEFGHILTGIQVPGGNANLTQAMKEGLSDFWAATVHDTPIIAAWSAQNEAGPVQGGWLPRKAEAQDVFPEHRSLATGGYADGQILNWALWSTRTGLNNLGALGTLSIDISLLDALTTIGGGTSTTDRAIHDDFVELLQQLTTQYSDSRSVHKLLSGFARAGITLSERDAIVDIDDDYLDRGSAAGPTFTIWTGRDYQFNGNTVVTANAYNTRFEVEVASDPDFSVNLVSSGILAGVAVSPEGVPMATWTLPAGNWNTLKSEDYLYYRVTTTDNAGGNVRSSEDPGNGFLTGVPAARAVINDSGGPECTCAASSAAAGGASALWMMLVPFALALIWRQRARRM